MNSFGISCAQNSELSRNKVSHKRFWLIYCAQTTEDGCLDWYHLLLLLLFLLSLFGVVYIFHDFPSWNLLALYLKRNCL